MNARSRGVGDPVVRALSTVGWARSMACTDRWPAKRVAPLAHRDAPMRHGARRVLLRDAFEHLDGFGKPERVQQRHGLVEVVAHGRRARGLELHARAADLIRRHRAVVFVLRDSDWQERATYRSKRGQPVGSSVFSRNRGDRYCPLNRPGSRRSLSEWPWLEPLGPAQIASLPPRARKPDRVVGYDHSDTPAARSAQRRRPVGEIAQNRARPTRQTTIPSRTT